MDKVNKKKNKKTETRAEAIDRSIRNGRIITIEKFRNMVGQGGSIGGSEPLPGRGPFR
jgi:hypothetical protein